MNRCFIFNVISRVLQLKRHYFHNELHPKEVVQTQFFFRQRRVIQLE